MLFRSDPEPGGNSQPRPALCLEDSYQQRQTALFTDICQPSSQSGAWVSTGRRRPVSGDRATPEGPGSVYTQQWWALGPTGSCVSVHRWQEGRALLLQRPPPSLLPSFLLFFQQIFGCLFCSTPVLCNRILTVNKTPFQPHRQLPGQREAQTGNRNAQQTM